MSAVKGATLRRQQRHRHTPDAAHGCDTPIPLVFRTHNDGLSKAAFLFCPKNFNLVNPTTAAAAASPNAASPNSTSGSPAGAARHGAGVPNASGAGSPSNPKRFAASTSPAATTAAATATATAATAASAAPSADAESVRTLVEAIVELRPFFAPPLFNSSTNSGSTMNLSALVSGSPPTASTAHLDQSPSFNSLMVRPSSSASLGLGSYVDLMSLSSFASPTAYGGGAGANDSFNFSGTVTSAATGRYEDRPRAAGSPRAVGSAGGGQRMRPAAPHAAYAGGPGMLGGSSVHHNAGSSSSGGGGGGGAAGAGAGAAGGSGGVAGAAHTAIGTSASSLMHPSGGWICRAMAFNEKEVSHANGAISVNQSLTAKCALINEVAKGKIMARILSSYEEVQERYGLSHVELTVDNQYVSRSDLFLLSQALRERILYEGEEIHLCGFRLRVREMLQVVSSGSGPSPVSSSPAIPISAPTTGAGSGSGASPANIANTPANNTGGTSSYVRVGCGLVLPTTRINFQSLSPVHYIVVELAREMWDTTIDGRIALTWALRKFLSELLLKQLPKRKASPLIRVVFTGRLQKEFQFDRHGDVFHVLELPREARNVDVVEEVRMHCEALVDRVLREVQTTAYHQLEAEVAAYRDGRAGRGGGGSGEQQPRGGGGAAGGWREGEGDSGVYSSPTTTSPDRDAALEAYVRQRQTYIDAITPKRLFVHAKQSNTLEALSILVERSNHHYIDRHLTLSGHAITVVSAGKGFYQVTNSLVQIVCARLHDMGLEKVHVVCIGRPPLHVTPLLEYTADDDTLRSQYHLHSRALSSTGAARGGAHAPSTAVERYYETPEWISVFFFHSALSNNGGETVFELLPKEHWQREHPVMSIADMMWQPQELRSSPTPASLQQQQQQQLRSSPNSGGASAGSAGKTLLGTAQAGGGRHSDYVKGGEEDGHYATSNAAARQRGDLDEPAPAAAEGGPGCEPVGHGGGVEDVASAHHVSADAAANPPLLIPGLGLRFYPLADVTLPVATAAAASADFSVDRWESKSAMCADDGNATSAAATAVSPTWASRSYFPDVLEVSATASHGTDLLPSLASPASHHASLGPRTKTSTTAGRASPVFAAGGAASSPLLVRTTTASSSVFTSPNVPMRGSMPRAGAPAMAAAWREHHHTLHGLHSSLNASQPHLAYPPHPAFAGAFPPLLQPSSTSPQRRGSGDGPRRDAEVGTGGSAQRRVRGGGSVGATTTAAVRMPPYPSSSSIAVSASGAGDGRRHSQPNSLTSYTMMSHPSLHISRSFDYQTTANPTYHSLGAFERSVRSAGSSLTGRHHHHNSSPSSHLQPRSLLCREGSVAKSSGNSICGRPPASGAAAAAAAAAVNESGAGLQSLEGGGGVGGAPAAACAWYCLHAAKLTQECGGGFATAGAGYVSHGVEGASLKDEPHNSSRATTAASTVVQSSPHPGVALPAVLPSTKAWHKPLSRTRTDAVFCGCNVVDSDLRNGYLILEITLDPAVLLHCFWSPRLILDDQGWSDLMSCFTGRDDRLTLGADADADSDEEEEEGDDSMTIGGGSSTEGYFNSANGAPASSSSLRAGGLPGATAAASGATQDGESGGANTVHSAGSTTGEVYRFQSDFRAAEAFCRSHSGISTDGRTLVLPTHNNTVHFQSSEEILLRLQPHLFVAAVDEGGDAAAERRGLVSPTPSHRVHGESAEEDGDNEGGADATAASAQKEGEMTATATTVFQERREAAFTAVSATDAMTATAADTAVADRGEEGGRGMLPVTRTAEEARGAGSAASPTASSGSSRTTAAASPSSDAGRGPHTGVEAPITDSLQNPSSASAPATTAVATSNEEGGVVDRSLPAPVEVTAGSTTTASTRPAALRLPPAPAGALSSPTGALHHENGFSTGRHGRGANSLVSGALITVGFVQMRNSLLFAIKPINPLRPSAEEELREDVTALSQSAESASTATVMRRRWQWKHPDIAAEPPHLASWTRLCTCRLLPLYGSKPPYPREGFYTVSPHQYTVTNPSATGGHADPADEKKRLLEFVLQRLQQQYQIVVDTPGLAAGAQWPRADPSPNARLEMSLGHQTHTLKVGETAKTISVTRMLHRGMYSNGQVTHMVSYRYLLWNYLADEFDTREVHMEAQVGERNAFRWESLDRWLQERPEVAIPRGPDLWMRSREVAVMLLPEDPTHPPSFDEFHRFIGYRFSVHLSTHGKVDWQRHSGGVSIDVPDSTLLTFPAAPPLMDVVLVHDNPLTLDTRNVMDRVTGRTIAFEVPVEERYMSVDVSLPKQYDTQCCYFLKVSWLVCAAPLVVDWFGSFIANASRFGFHAVPMSCYYTSPKAESLTAHYDVEAASIAEEPLLRRALAELLVSPAYRYYPDTPTITRNCRLVHLTGLCCVVLPPSVTRVAQWYQNACLRQGSVEQLELLVQFKEAEARARERVAAMLSGPHA